MANCACPRVVGRHVVLLAGIAVLALGGCATAIRGTTQRVGVATDPPGAECLLKNRLMDTPARIAATPGDAEVARSASELNLTCRAPGYVDHEEQIDAILAKHVDEESQRRLLIASDVTLGLAGMAGVTMGVATGAAAFGGVAAFGGGTALVVAPPVIIGMVLLAPISFIVDLATGATFGYSAVLSAVLTPASFPSEGARDAYVAGGNARIDRVAKALRDYIEANCPLTCEGRKERDADEIARQRKNFAAAIAKTRIEPPP